MSVETVDRTRGELILRNKMQMEMLRIYIEEGIVSEDDPEACAEIFRQVSDVLDGNNPDYDSIRTALESGDYNTAALMLKTVIQV